MSTKATSCGCGGTTPIQARVASWLDTWAPGHEILGEEFRTMLGEVFDEVERRADGMHDDNNPSATHYWAAMMQVRAELCERKP